VARPDRQGLPEDLPEIPENLAGVYAYHLEQAGRDQDALSNYVRAARYSQQQYQNEESLTLWLKVWIFSKRRRLDRKRGPCTGGHGGGL